MFAAGYEVIATHLAQGLNITTGQRVTRVDTSGTGVQVTTERGSLNADAVVVAVPLGVLKAGHISFMPRLPDAQAQAIQALGMGLLNKLYLKFDTDFWTADSPTDWIESIGAPGAARQEWTQWVNLKRPRSKFNRRRQARWSRTPLLRRCAAAPPGGTTPAVASSQTTPLIKFSRINRSSSDPRGSETIPRYWRFTRSWARAT